MEDHHNHLSAEETLEAAGVKPTSNRILVLREIMHAGRPLSLMDLDMILDTLEKSSIFRVLTLLLEHDVIHAVEDGRGVVLYESCHGHHHQGTPHNDFHAHFYCEECNKVFCLENIPAPHVNLPEGFEAHSVNFMLKGICPSCSKKH